MPADPAITDAVRAANAAYRRANTGSEADALTIKYVDGSHTVPVGNPEYVEGKMHSDPAVRIVSREVALALIAQGRAELAE